MTKATPPLITIIGKSGAGKTTFLVKLIPELKRRNLKVGTIKHHAHRGFEIDTPGKDSWHHAQAGSSHVVISSPDKIAAYRLVDRELTIDEIASGMTDVDIILVEGHKNAGKPSIEIIRSEISRKMIGSPEQCFAVVSNIPLDVDIPQFKLEDAALISDLIISHFQIES